MESQQQPQNQIQTLQHTWIVTGAEEVIACLGKWQKENSFFSMNVPMPTFAEKNPEPINKMALLREEGCLKESFHPSAFKKYS